MIVFDAHLDLAWNAIEWNRDLTRDVAAIRAAEAGMKGKGRGCNTVAFPELRRGQVAVSIATLLARIYPKDKITAYTTYEAAYGAAMGQLAYYRAMEARGAIRMIEDSPTLDAHVRQWQETGGEGVPLGMILSMEGADPVLAPEQVPEWFEAGLRIIGPAHYGISPYAHGTATEGGLLPRGSDLLRAMDRAGMLLDITHLADQSFWEALDIFQGPVLASHHNCRALVPGDRQLDDDQIRALVARDAVIGVALDSWMLYPGWIRGETQPEVVGLEAALDHIDHVCQLAGDAKHSGIGTDLDGGFGREQSPRDLDTIADLQRFPEMLGKRGYSDVDIEGIMYRNWLRFFGRAWSEERSTRGD